MKHYNRVLYIVLGDFKREMNFGLKRHLLCTAASISNLHARFYISWFQYFSWKAETIILLTIQEILSQETLETAEKLFTPCKQKEKSSSLIFVTLVKMWTIWTNALPKVMPIQACCLTHNQLSTSDAYFPCVCRRHPSSLCRNCTNSWQQHKAS